MKIGKLLGEATNAGEGEDGQPNWAWEDVCEAMTEIMGNHTLWNATVENFGWRNQSGSRDGIVANQGDGLIGACLPNTDCTFKVYRYGRKGFAIDNAHHDKPTGGEWYYITPAKA